MVCRNEGCLDSDSTGSSRRDLRLHCSGFTAISFEMIFLPLDNQKAENEWFLAATYAHTIEDDAEEDFI